jgi:hypothetical protein
MDGQLYFHDGYRFKTSRPRQYQTPILARCVGNAFVGLAADGVLTIAADYAWDGASGPVPQTRRVMRASVIHDALYQLMREHELAPAWRKAADQVFRDTCIADGMPRLIAWTYYAAVRAFGARHIDPKTRRPELVAPGVNQQPPYRNPAAPNP